MKFKIVRSKFLEGLKKVQNIVGSKGTMQILQNVMIEAKEKQLLLTTTDLDISIRSVIECEVDADGNALHAAGFGFHLLDIRFHLGEERIRIDGIDIF